MEKLNVCINKNKKDALLILTWDQYDHEVCITHTGKVMSYEEASHILDEENAFEVERADSRLTPDQLQSLIILEQAVFREKEMELTPDNIFGALVVVKTGNTYWFREYSKELRLKYDQFRAVVDYARSIAEQADKIQLEGWETSPYAFYYIQEDFVDRLQKKFPLVEFHKDSNSRKAS